MLKPLLEDPKRFDDPAPLLSSSIEVRQVPDDDPRVELRGQHGVFASKHIPAWTIIGKSVVISVLTRSRVRHSLFRTLLLQLFRLCIQANQAPAGVCLIIICIAVIVVIVVVVVALGQYAGQVSLASEVHYGKDNLRRAAKLSYMLGLENGFDDDEVLPDGDAVKIDCFPDPPHRGGRASENFPKGNEMMYINDVKGSKSLQKAENVFFLEILLRGCAYGSYFVHLSSCRCFKY